MPLLDRATPSQLVLAVHPFGVLYQGDEKVTVKRASVAASGSGDNTLVAAVTGKKLVLLSYQLVGAGAVNVKFKSGAGTDLTGAMTIAAAGGTLTGNPNGDGWVITAAAAALVLNLSGAVGVNGMLTYAEVD